MLACLVDGESGHGIVADSRGLAYGDGVFRTLLVCAGTPLHLDAHLATLAADAARLELEMPAAALLLADSRKVIQQAGTPARAVLKWLLVRRSEARGYASSGGAVQRIVSLSSAPRYPTALWTAGVRAELSAVRLGAQPLLAGIKHLNRLEQVLAARRWPAGVDELLMCDDAGRLIGGLRTNLFWVRDGRLQTPRLSRCGVAGTLRGQLLQLAAGLQIDHDEVDAGPEALRESDEAFVCNALIGIWPLRQLADRHFTAPGPVTQRLTAVLDHPRLD